MNTTTDLPAEDLRHRMVDAILANRPIDARVEAAMRAVPRHDFVPAAPLTDAYANEAVITKRAADGTSLSCASVPSLVAVMLDRLQVQPGHRILEIGAGTGYNAALLAHLTGEHGYVSTVDIDPDITAAARHALDLTGNRSVHVHTGDGALGDPEHGPYDRIIVTVGAWDIPAAWWQQLKPGGRLVVPLRWRGQTRAIAFTHHGDHMTSDWVELCGFVPMIGQEGEHTAHIDNEHTVALHWDADQPIHPEKLHGVLNQPKTSTGSGITVVANESFDGIWLRLATADPDTTCRIQAEPAAVNTGRCTPAIPIRTAALAGGSSLAYLTVTRTTDSYQREQRWELGINAHGPTAEQLTEQFLDQLRAWDTTRQTEPAITAYPATVAEPPVKVTITKPDSLLHVSY